MTRRAWRRLQWGLARTLLVSSTAIALAASAAEPTTAEYGYDDAGRLRSVVMPEMDAAYGLDAAGNRTTVTSTTGHGWPSFVQVPPLNYTRNYSISWGAATPAPHHYEVFEATNPGLTGESSYSSSTLNVSFTSKPYNTYYYRVRACDAAGNCGPRRIGPNPIVVQPPPPPGVPGVMTLTSPDLDGWYPISWVASNGAIPDFDLTYQLFEATASNFSNETQVYTGTTPSTNLTNRATGTYYYRVRGCNGPSCSGYSTGTMSVVLTPDTPGAATVPAPYTNVGSYTVSWTAPGGIVPATRYELLEKLTFGSETLIYSGPNTSFPVTGKGDGTYSYRLRGCNAGCSAYTAAAGGGPVVMVDTIAPTPPASLSRTQQTFLNWSGGSTDSGGGGSGSLVDRWRVYRNGSLIATVLYPTVAYNDTAAPSNQTHTWTVRSVDRAGNESVNSPPLTAYVDTIPPNAPTGVSAVGVTTQSIQITWNAAVDPNGGTVSGYLVYRNGVNQQLASGTSLLDVGLIPGTTYTYTVVAFDTGGNGSLPSAPANGTTLTDIPTVPNMPSGLNVSPSGRWGAPSYTVFWAGSGPPTSYYVLEEQGIPTNVTSTSKAYSNKPPGFYNYRVKACSPTNICSAYTDYVSYEVCGSGGCM